MTIPISDVLLNSGAGVSAVGSVAIRLLESGMNINALRTCDVLRKDEWVKFDEVVVEIARSRLIAVGDLVSRGLTFDLPNALGTTVIEYEKISDMEPAKLSMSGVTEEGNDRVEYTLESLPVPIGHKEFNINIRALTASRTRGIPLDTTQAAVSARKLAELNDSTVFKGATITVSGKTIPGYLTAADRNTGSLTGDWELTAQTGTIIIADVLAMVKALVGDNMFGPYVLYVPINYGVKLDEDFKANSDKTIRERLLQIEEITAVRATTNLAGGASGEVVLVQMTSDVVDMVMGIEPTTVQWETAGGMITNFKVLSIMLPRVKSDALLQSGIAHYSV